MEIKTFLIVGSGIFGVSAAYHLAKTQPRCRVILVETDSLPEQSGASIDINRIIRIEYEDPVYLRLALKARKAWMEDPLWARFYHPSEKLTVGELDSSRRILEQLRRLGIESEAGFVSVNGMKHRYSGMFNGMALQDLEEVYINPKSGWVEAFPALAEVMKTATNLGVDMVQATVTSLMFDKSGNCTGVRAADGRTFTATHTILATGAHTAQLLASSAPNRQDLRVENRLMAAGCVIGHVKLSPTQRKKFANLPITVHDVGEIYGEVLPPTNDGYLKFAGETSFRNSIFHAESGQMISVPTNIDAVPVSMKNECRRICDSIFGALSKDLKFDSYRICWDNFACDGDFVISSHPTCDGLYFATGGSFHGWKFFPILGELIGKMIDGTLDEELRAKWAWDRDMVGGGVDKAPEREWKDIVGGTEKGGSDGQEDSKPETIRSRCVGGSFCGF